MPAAHTSRLSLDAFGRKKITAFKNIRKVKKSVIP